MIRPATEADLQAILDIYNDAVINTTAVYTYTPHTLDMRRQWFKEHREAGLPVFVLEEDGVIAGFATYGNFRPWPAYKYSIEHSIYVHKDFRRRHIATRLMEKLLEAATREFSTRPFNEASINQIIKEAGIPRGSFYMYFQDKEDLFRYLLKGYVDQLFMLLEEFLLRNGGDIFQALLDLYDYVQAKIDNQHLGEIGAMTGIIRCNSGMQKNGLLEMLDAETLLQRLGGAVNPDLLDLRQDRDLGDILGTLLVVAAPMIYTGLQAGGDPGTRDRLENILNIFKRGMGKRPTAEIENKEIT
mgnify:CR=1 FL=1